MKRFRRWLLHGMALLLFLVCIAVVILWILSPGQFGTPPSNSISIDYDSHQIYLRSDLIFLHGATEWYVRRDSYTQEFFPLWKLPLGFRPKFHFHHEPQELAGGEFWHRFFWNRVDDGNNFYPNRYFEMEIACPDWLLVFAFGFVPTLIAARKVLKRVSRNPHACKVCDYDLRATPDRCPECGTIPSKK